MAIQQSLFKAKILPELSRRENTRLLAALESLVSPEAKDRRDGFESLIAMDAHRRSTVGVVALASKLREPDLNLRADIVLALGETLRTEAADPRPPDRVRAWLRHALSEMRRREVYALLQVAVRSGRHFEAVFKLLNACSYSGLTLVQILTDRNADVRIRAAAAEAIGALGFWDAAPTLENLIDRLINRHEGQLAMAFAPRQDAEADTLLPVLRQAYQELQEAER